MLETNAARVFVCRVDVTSSDKSDCMGVTAARESRALRCQLRRVVLPLKLKLLLIGERVCVSLRRVERS